MYTFNVKGKVPIRRGQAIRVVERAAILESLDKIVTEKKECLEDIKAARIMVLGAEKILLDKKGVVKISCTIGRNESEIYLKNNKIEKILTLLFEKKE